MRALEVRADSRFWDYAPCVPEEEDLIAEIRSRILNSLLMIGETDRATELLLDRLHNSHDRISRMSDKLKADNARAIQALRHVGDTTVG